MLGLPSTSEMTRRLPKEAFYRNLKVSTKLKAEFVDGIEAFVVRNTLKPTTVNVSAGKRVSEVLVLEVQLRAREVPKAALTTIATNNPHKLIFVCTYEDEACAAIYLDGLITTKWVSLSALSFKFNPASTDTLWDSLASQIAYGDMGKYDITVEERWAKDSKLTRMKDELIKLETKSKKEKQFARKNELFVQAKKLKAEIVQLEEGM